MKIVCIDHYGKEHLIEEKQMVNRLSAYGIYIRGGEVLLVQDARSLRWELPGGGVEPGETTEEGLIREFIEETGISPEEDFSLLCEWQEYYYDLPSQEAWRSKRKCYRINIVSSEHTLLTHGNGDDVGIAAFVPVEKLETLHISPQIRKALSSALCTY